MASETFVSAMMLITGVVAASILIVAVLPVVWGMVGTFSSASAATDKSMRSDFKIVTTYAKYVTASAPYIAGANVSVWMKNTGTVPIGTPDFKTADVYVGRSDYFGRATLTTNVPPFPPVRATTAPLIWFYTLYEPTATSGNNFWDPGETLEIDTFSPASAGVYASGQIVYFQFTLPSGVSRSTQFTSL